MSRQEKNMYSAGQSDKRDIQVGLEVLYGRGSVLRASELLLFDCGLGGPREDGGLCTSFIQKSQVEFVMVAMIKDCLAGIVL